MLFTGVGGAGRKRRVGMRLKDAVCEEQEAAGVTLANLVKNEKRAKKRKRPGQKGAEMGQRVWDIENRICAFNQNTGLLQYTVY